MIIVQKVSNLKFANAQRTSINADVKFEHLDEVVPFTATASDPEEHGRLLYAGAVAGQFGPIAPYQEGN